MKIKSIVIGLGQIGMLYDYYQKSKDYILTHCNALYSNPEFELLAGVDRQKSLRSKFKKKFEKPAFKDIKSVKLLDKIDLVVVAVPTNRHLDIMNDLLAVTKPKIIVLEKPIADNLNDAKKIHQITFDDVMTI